MWLEAKQKALNISIHTLTRRVTPKKMAGKIYVGDFNPHPHTEGDTKRPTLSPGYSDFNPHPHTEGDLKALKAIRGIQVFQSTPSHGG